MAYTVKTVKTIKVDSKRVWATISAGGGLDKWLPVITDCRLEGIGVGATRYCTMANGAKLKERILEIDNTRNRFRYSIDEHPLPATNLVGTVEVRDLGNRTSEVSWGSEFDCDAGHKSELEGMFKGIYEQAIDGLEKHLRQS